MGAAIRGLRQEQWLSQRVLAGRAEISSSWLSRIETGAVEASWGSLRKIAYALDLTLPELIEEAERIEPGRRN
jgi:transcriptional regulator with XRE-family HTH domain